MRKRTKVLLTRIDGHRNVSGADLDGVPGLGVNHVLVGVVGVVQVFPTSLVLSEKMRKRTFQ